MVAPRITSQDQLDRTGGRGEVSTKSRLVNLRTNEILVFHYNPGSFTDRYGSNFAEVDIPGGVTPLFQFGSGAARELRLQLLFNEYKQEASRPKQKITHTVEEAIRFIQGGMEPKKIAVNQGGLSFTVASAPDPFVFLWGQIKFNGIHPGIECIIDDCNVTRNFFRRGTQEAIRATVDITLKQFRIAT